MQASVFSGGSQRPSPINLAFEAPQAASKPLPRGRRRPEGPAPGGRRSAAVPEVEAAARVVQRRVADAVAETPRALVRAAGHVGALPAARTTVGSSHLMLWRSGVHGQPQPRPAAQIVLTSLGYQCVTMRSQHGTRKIAARKTEEAMILASAVCGFWWFLVAAGVGAARVNGNEGTPARCLVLEPLSARFG